MYKFLDFVVVHEIAVVFIVNYTYASHFLPPPKKNVLKVIYMAVLSLFQLIL